jgi:hypothetical protein
MAAETAVTPLEVALEFVATKVALLGALETVAGTSPLFDDAAYRWAWESPVELPRGEEYPELVADSFAEPMYARSAEIEEQIMWAVGRYLIASADLSQASRPATTGGGDDGH